MKIFAFVLLAIFPFAFTEEFKGTVLDANSQKPIPQAELFILEGNLNYRSDDQGVFKINLKPGDYTLIIKHIGHVSKIVMINIAPQKNLTKSFSLEPDNLLVETMVVLGSRRYDRTVLDSMVPIDVLSQSDLTQSGVSETAQALSLLVPSLNFPRATINDGTDHVRPATLRAMMPDQTLVLINGKRRHMSALLNVNGSIGRGTAAVDLNMIPTTAVDHIEVLRDGAAAQYGSDAIAGTINMVLKTKEEAYIQTNYGKTIHGDGQVKQLEAGFGRELGNGGFFHISGEGRFRDPTNRIGPDPRQQYFLLPDGRLDPREETINRMNHMRGDSASDNLNIFFNASVPLRDETLHWYSFGNFGAREGSAAGFYRRSLDNRNVRGIYPDGFLPMIESDIEDRSLVTGFKGAFGSWNWDWSASYGENEFDFNISNSVNASMGLDSPTEFDAGSLGYRQMATNLDFYRSIMLGSKSFNLAMGAEHRQERFTIKAGEEASYIDGGVPILDGPNQGGQTALGSQVFPGFRPTDAGSEARTSTAIYTDLEGDLSEQWQLGLAMRYESYDDFGETLSGKLSMRYEINETWILRSAFNTGFRAPSLHQSFYSTTSTTFINDQPFEIRTFPVNDPAAIALGAKDLEAETSRNFSAGIVSKPNKNFYITLDYYRIDIDDRISLSENLRGESIREILERNQFFGIDGGRYFHNALNTTSEGLDLVLRMAKHYPNNLKLRLTAGVNLNDTKITKLDENPSELDGVNQLLVGRAEQGRIEEGQPKNKTNITLNLDHGPWSFLARTTGFGSHIARHQSDPSRDQTFAAKWLLDLDIAYNFSNSLRISLGGNNITDKFPDKVIDQNSFNGIFTYPSFSPLGSNGAYYYLKLRFHP